MTPNSTTSAPGRSETLGYAITAAIFFVLGFLLASLLGVNLLSDEPNQFQVSVDQRSINNAVNGTLAALTPSPEPTATRAPIEITYDENNYQTGSPTAPITLVEFGDFQCSFCAQFALTNLPALRERYGDQLQFVYRDYPIFGAMSERAAWAASCADQQDHYWEFHEAIFGTQYAGTEHTPVSEEFLRGIAADLELDMDAFDQCFADETVLDAIAVDVQEAVDLIGFQGTPHFLLNGTVIRGNKSLAEFIQLFDTILIEKGIEPPR